MCFKFKEFYQSVHKTFSHTNCVTKTWIFTQDQSFNFNGIQLCSVPLTTPTSTLPSFCPLSLLLCLFCASSNNLWIVGSNNFISEFIVRHIYCFRFETGAFRIGIPPDAKSDKPSSGLLTFHPLPFVNLSPKPQGSYVLTEGQKSLKYR